MTPDFNGFAVKVSAFMPEGVVFTRDAEREIVMAPWTHVRFLTMLGLYDNALEAARVLIHQDIERKFKSL